MGRNGVSMKFSIHACLALVGLTDAWRIESQDANQVLSRETRGAGRGMAKCLKQVCRYEDFAERAENVYGKAIFGEVSSWRFTRKKNKPNQSTVAAFQKLYKKCHFDNPDCRKQGKQCECFQNMLYYLQNEEYPTTTAEPTTAAQVTTTKKSGGFCLWNCGNNNQPATTTATPTTTPKPSTTAAVTTTQKPTTAKQTTSTAAATTTDDSAAGTTQTDCWWC